MKKMVLVGTLVLPLVCIAGTSMSVDLTPEEQLGKDLYQDVNFSYNSTQSCQTCHDEGAGFADPTNAADPVDTPVSLGADGFSKGGRNAPTAAYSGYSPIRYKVNGTKEYYGGLFWDGRADGSSERLADPLAEQAQGPPLNEVEMAMPDEETIVSVIKAYYSDQFQTVYGFNDFSQTEEAYALFAEAIAAYERSPEVMQFNAKFDTHQLTVTEKNGRDLFKEHCNSCHYMGNSVGFGPLFTTFGYANIGIPQNPRVDGDENDLGLGGNVGEAEQNGKFKVPTLRNVAKTAPYGHNGYFATLEEIVDFKNTRDRGGWEEPDVSENLSDLIGDMKMTKTQVADVVEFLKALTDEAE